MSAAELEELYHSLNFPSAAQFKKALARRGIPARAKDVEDFVKSRSERQVIAPPPKYEGNIVSFDEDHRWAADLIAFTSRPATRKEKTFTHVLLVEDLFTRFLWARPLRSTSDATDAFRQILDESGRKPRRLDTDGGPEFVDRRFEALVQQRGIEHVVKQKDDLQALAPIDAAISQLKKAIKRRREARGGDWLDQLEPVVKGHNSNVHSATDAPPEDMNADATFSQQKEAAEGMEENTELVQKRRERLEKAGAYRVFLPKAGGLRRRTDEATWSEEIREVASFPSPGVVRDTRGRDTLTKHARAVPKDSSAQETISPWAIVVRALRRRRSMVETLRPFALALRDALGPGKSFSAAARLLKERNQHFSDALKAHTMSFEGFVSKFPDLLWVDGGTIRPTGRNTLPGT